MHDGRVEPGLDALVQEHRVEHLPGGRVEAEGDVGDAERGLHVGVAPLDLADRLDRLEAVAAGLLLAGGDREGQAVDEDVARPACPSCRSGRRSAGRRPRTFYSAVRAWPSSSMVSATTAAPCSRDERHDPGEPGVRAVAVLVVDRVDRPRGRRAAPARPRSPAARSSRARAAAWTRWRAG